MCLGGTTLLDSAAWAGEFVSSSRNYLVMRFKAALVWIVSVWTRNHYSASNPVKSPPETLIIPIKNKLV